MLCQNGLSVLWRIVSTSGLTLANVSVLTLPSVRFGRHPAVFWFFFLFFFVCLFVFSFFFFNRTQENKTNRDHSSSTCRRQTAFTTTTICALVFTALSFCTLFTESSIRKTDPVFF